MVMQEILDKITVIRTGLNLELCLRRSCLRRAERSVSGAAPWHRIGLACVYVADADRQQWFNDGPQVIGSNRMRMPGVVAPVHADPAVRAAKANDAARAVATA